MDFKYKIADVAKEFGMPAKKVVETVSGVTGVSWANNGVTVREKPKKTMIAVSQVAFIMRQVSISMTRVYAK